MENTLVIDFNDELLVMEGLAKNSFSLIYMTPPLNSRVDVGAHFRDIPIDCSLSKDERSAAIQERREQKRIAAEREYATYISHLVEMARSLLVEGGTLCFVVRSHMSDQCNYQMILERFFASVSQISVECRAIRTVVGMPEHIIVYCCKVEKGAFFDGLREPAPIENFDRTDGDGRRYRRTVLTIPDPDASRPSLHYEWKGIKPREGLAWRYTKERLQERYEAGYIDIVGSRAYGRQYHDESSVVVPSTWSNDTKPGQLLSVENVTRLLTMFTSEGELVLCPFEKDGVLSYCANRDGRLWISLYSPIDERHSLISSIPDDDYVLSEDFRSESAVSYAAVVKSSSELSELSEKMHSLQSAVLAIQQSLGVEGTDEESVADAISAKIESILSSRDVESCIPQVKEWLSPYWNRLESESRGYLPIGEFVRRELDSQGDANTDYAPALIEYCKVMETELFSKMFRGYVQDLIDERVDVKREFPDDFNKRFEANVFAEFVHSCIRYDRHRPYNWRFELGKMARVLTRVLRDSDLRGIYADFRGFLEDSFVSDFFGSDFDDRLTEIAQLRNECAHRSLMHRERSELARELIRQKLDSILAYYN